MKPKRGFTRSGARVPGFMRRKRYQCYQCLGDILEYPGLVVDAAQLWCYKCQEEQAGIKGEEAGR